MSTGDATETTLAEVALVGRAQDGDVASFEVLVRRYQAPVFRLAQRMLADRGDAEDVVQDTFVLVWRRLPTLVDASLFHGWVYQIATRRCLNVIRSRSRRPDVPTESSDLEAGRQAGTEAAHDSDPATVAEHTAQRAGLDAVLQSMPAEQRACWVLREMHELTYPEIAYATQLPIATVRGRIARARQNLAKGMQSWR